MECAFGELVKRWGILWRPQSFNMETTMKILKVLFLLHNLCINERLDLCSGYNVIDISWGRRPRNEALVGGDGGRPPVAQCQ